MHSNEKKRSFPLKNAGFTRIELLVVVLIIGILAAVALPKYELAVRKTKYMSGVSLARPFMDAEDRFLLAAGSYTHRLEDLDIQCPASMSDYHVSEETGVSECKDTQGRHLVLAKTYLKYTSSRDLISFDWKFSDRMMYCIAADSIGHALCKSLGGTDRGDGYYPIQM